MQNNNENEQRDKFRTRPIFIIGNLVFAIFVATVVSSIDSLAVRGGGFSVYAGQGSSNGAQGESLDADGNPIQGDASIVRVATNTPEPVPVASETPDPAEDEPAETNEAGEANGSEANGQDQVLPAVTATALPTIVCVDPPAGWFSYIVRPGDRLGDIAIRAGTTIPDLQQKNCLPTTDINYGTIIYLPLDLENTPNQNETNVTPFVLECEGAPAGWLPYTVQRGDNVFRIAMGSGISREELVKFNCLPSESVLVAGQIILLPPGSTYLTGAGAGAQPTATATPEQIATNTPAPTATPIPSETPTPTTVITPTDEPLRPEETATSALPTRPAEAETPTSTPTAISATATPTPELPTETPTIVSIETPTPVATEIATELPTEIPTEPPTEAPIDTPTIVATEIPTEIPTEAATEVPTDVPTDIPTAVPVVIPTEEPTPDPEVNSGFDYDSFAL